MKGYTGDIWMYGGIQWGTDVWGITEVWTDYRCMGNIQMYGSVQMWGHLETPQNIQTVRLTTNIHANYIWVLYFT